VRETRSPSPASDGDVTLVEVEIKIAGPEDGNCDSGAVMEWPGIARPAGRCL
jgi:hypothetical protein